VLAAVRQSGEALKFAAEELRGDREIVLEAVRENGDALQFASEELKADREVVLEAVRRNDLALMHAPLEIRGESLLKSEHVADNPIAVEGSVAPTFSISELALRAGGVEVVAHTLGGNEHRTVLPRSASVGDVARWLRTQHGSTGLVYLNLSGQNTPVNPFDANKLLVELMGVAEQDAELWANSLTDVGADSSAECAGDTL